MVYVNIPVDFGKPTAEDFRLLYRVIHEGAPVGETAIKMNCVWKKFIDDTLASSGREGEVF